MRVTVIPNAKKNSVKEIDAQNVEVCVRAKTERNQANIELKYVLAKHFGVDPSAIHILTGHHARKKRVEITDDLLDT